jgi:TolB-like protein
VATTIAKKPSIAVLPLANMSGDPEQEFFADGLTEDITNCKVSRGRSFICTHEQWASRCCSPVPTR